jgi:hypothetical protein
VQCTEPGVARPAAAESGADENRHLAHDHEGNEGEVDGGQDICQDHILQHYFLQPGRVEL